MEEQWTFPEGAWWIPAGFFLLTGLALVIWSYRSAPPGTWRWVCPVLKALGIAALAFCLLEPIRTGQRAVPGANLAVLVADNSQGMQVTDPGDRQTRGESLRILLDGAAQDDWQTVLGESFEIRRHFFDTRLRGAADFSGLNFDGRATALGNALESLKERYSDRPVAGIFVFTDGNATDLRGPLPDLTGIPPVHPVIIGGKDSLRDLSLRQVSARQSAFEDAPVSILADLSASGLSGVPVVVRLQDAAGALIEEQRFRPASRQENIQATFELGNRAGGVQFYQVHAAIESELKKPAPATSLSTVPSSSLPSTNTVPGEPGETVAAAEIQTNALAQPLLRQETTIEATLANNARSVVVDRGPSPYRVLYVSGRPNWEYKFLQRALVEDPQIEMVGLVRVANREPKFDFRGRAGETSNPLFRGFGEQASESVVRYDQPVLVRLNPRDERELVQGFPKAAEELFVYHGIILDDVEAGFFGPDQAALIQRFVSERGGGVLMLGGMETFKEGRYHRTPVGDLLPVYLDSRSDATPPLRPVQFRMAREGWLQPWARLRGTESDERQRREAMPPFAVFNPVSGVKPGASVIAEAIDAEGRAHPTLTVQRYGRGRSGALTIGDFWRWGMRSPEARQDLNRTWRQLVRWLVADTPGAIELTAEPVTDDANGAMKLRVIVRDENFQPVDDATVTLTLQPVLAASTDPSRPNLDEGATRALELRADPSTTEPGLYELTYVPRLTAGFHAIARAVRPNGSELGRAETGWSTDLAADEFRSLNPNVPLLEEIARRTGGTVLRATDLDQFISELPERTAPVMEPWTQPAWHTPFLFLFALACFASEWGIRRWRGLP